MKGIFKKIRGLIKNEDGMGTLEILLIVAVLVGIALIFRGEINEWVTKLTDSTETQIEQFNSDPATDSNSDTDS